MFYIEGEYRYNDIPLLCYDGYLRMLLYIENTPDLPKLPKAL